MKSQLCKREPLPNLIKWFHKAFLNIETSLDIIISNIEQNNKIQELNHWLDNEFNFKKIELSLIYDQL